MRLFVAVWPAPAVVEAVAALDRPAVDGVRWTRPEQWHVTLRFLGNVGDDELAGLEAALAGVGETHRAREAVVGPVTACFGRSILMVPVAGLDDLGADTVAATSSFGEPPDDRPFSGHLTLARSGSRGRPGSRGRRGPDLRPFAGISLAASWPVDEVTLVRSTPGPGGPTYDVIGRWALAG